MISSIHLGLAADKRKREKAAGGKAKAKPKKAPKKAAAPPAAMVPALEDWPEEDDVINDGEALSDSLDSDEEINGWCDWCSLPNFWS